jgi:hypothetical protein
VAVGNVWSAVFALFRKEINTPYILLLVGVPTLCITTLGAVAFSLVADWKRRFFLAPVSTSSLWSVDSQTLACSTISANTIYEAEDDLYGSISWPKKPERPVDYYAAAIGGLDWALFSLIGLIYSSSIALQIFLAILILIIILAVIFCIIAGRRRLPR